MIWRTFVSFCFLIQLVCHLRNVHVSGASFWVHRFLRALDFLLLSFLRNFWEICFLIFLSRVAALSWLSFVIECLRNFIRRIICKLFQFGRVFVKMFLFDFLMLWFIQFVFDLRCISICILHLHIGQRLRILKLLIFKIIGPNINRRLRLWLALVQRSHSFIFFLLVSILVHSKLRLLFKFLRVLDQMVKRSVLVGVRGGVRLKRSFNCDLLLCLSLYFQSLLGLFFFFHFDLWAICEEIAFIFVVLFTWSYFLSNFRSKYGIWWVLFLFIWVQTATFLWLALILICQSDNLFIIKSIQ